MQPIPDEVSEGSPCCGGRVFTSGHQVAEQGRGSRTEPCPREGSLHQPVVSSGHPEGGLWAGSRRWCKYSFIWRWSTKALPQCLGNKSYKSTLNPEWAQSGLARPLLAEPEGDCAATTPGRGEVGLLCDLNLAHVLRCSPVCVSLGPSVWLEHTQETWGIRGCGPDLLQCRVTQGWEEEEQAALNCKKCRILHRDLPGGHRGVSVGHTFTWL